MKHIELNGLPVISCRPLRSNDDNLSQAKSTTDYCRFAHQLRGQFSIVVRDGDTTIAITDPVGSYPIFYLEDKNNADFHVGTRLSDLVPKSLKRFNLQAVYSYLYHGGVVGGDTLYSDIRRLRPATVTSFHRGEVKTTHYLDWQNCLTPLDMRPEEAQEEFLRIARDYLGAVLSDADRVGCLFSGGTDSALVAALLRDDLEYDPACFTADFSIRHYSELQEASRNAGVLGLSIHPTRIHGRQYFGAFRRLNSVWTDAPCANSTSMIWFCLAQRAAETGITHLVTGDHADALFLGFEEFFTGFPRSTEDYITASERLSPEERLKRVIGEPKVSDENLKMLKALNLDKREFLQWITNSYDESREYLRALGNDISLSQLQQLNGQVWAGLPWQHNYLPIERNISAVRFISPFYDIHMIKFALALTACYKYRNGQTKAIVRDVLQKRTSLVLTKRASPLPLRLWALGRYPIEAHGMTPQLRSYYYQLCVRNVLSMGSLYAEVIKAAGFGLWLQAHEVSLP